MNKYYFTFLKSSERIQVIIANDSEQAQRVMQRFWGSRWAKCYTEEEWQQEQDKNQNSKSVFLQAMTVI